MSREVRRRRAADLRALEQRVRDEQARMLASIAEESERVRQAAIAEKRAQLQARLAGMNAADAGHSEQVALLHAEMEQEVSAYADAVAGTVDCCYFVGSAAWGGVGGIVVVGCVLCCVVAGVVLSCMCG